jgi:hypothetical protein
MRRMRFRLCLPLGNSERSRGHVGFGIVFDIGRGRNRLGCGRFGGCCARGGFRRRRSGCRFDAVGFERGLELASYGRFDARRRSFDELAHLFELCESNFAIDTEFGSDFVYAWFGSHFSPVWVCTLTGADHYLRTGLISSRSLVVHRSISLFVWGYRLVPCWF